MDYSLAATSAIVWQMRSSFNKIRSLCFTIIFSRRVRNSFFFKVWQTLISQQCFILGSFPFLVKHGRNGSSPWDPIRVVLASFWVDSLTKFNKSSVHRPLIIGAVATWTSSVFSTLCQEPPSTSLTSAHFATSYQTR